MVVIVVSIISIIRHRLPCYYFFFPFEVAAKISRRYFSWRVTNSPFFGDLNSFRVVVIFGLNFFSTTLLALAEVLARCVIEVFDAVMTPFVRSVTLPTANNAVLEGIL